MDRQLQSLVSTIADIMARERRTYEELRALKQSKKWGKKTENSTSWEWCKSTTKNIQDFIKTKFYRHLKFVEDDTKPNIFARVVEQEENKLPEGMLSQEEHNNLVTNCIRKAFTNLQYNSQTLIWQNYKHK